MPVDLCTPTLVALALIAVPLTTALRGTKPAFAGLCLIELAAAGWAYTTYFRRVENEALAIATLIYIVPQIIGLGIIALRSHALQPARTPRCPKCSYDLRATPDRCPGCGHSRPP